MLWKFRFVQKIADQFEVEIAITFFCADNLSNELNSLSPPIKLSGDHERRHRVCPKWTRISIRLAITMQKSFAEEIQSAGDPLRLLLNRLGEINTLLIKLNGRDLSLPIKAIFFM